MNLRIAPMLVAGLLAAPMALLPEVTRADVIVDTGPGPGGTPGGFTLWNNPGVATQYLAAEFNVATNVTVNSVELWMVGTSGTFSAGIFSDGGEIPGSELFSSDFSAASPAAWAGGTGLSWNLPAGTYWAVFEAEPGANGYAPSPSASPLGNEAFFNGTIWREQDSLSLGVRILGTVGTAPEPGTLALLGLGLAGLAASRRRKQ